MTDDLTIAYMLGVEAMRDKLHKQADEIERLRAENELMRKYIMIDLDESIRAAKLEKNDD